MKKFFTFFMLLFLLAVSAEEKRQNLALGALVFCNRGRNPEYVVDGRRNGAFHEAKILPGEVWLEVDLGELHDVDGLGIFFWWGDSRIYRYVAEGSKDGKRYFELLNGRKNTLSPTEKGVCCDFKPRKMRYVRVRVFSNTVNNGSHIREIEVYGR